MIPEHVSTQVSGYSLAHLRICLQIAKRIASSLFWVAPIKIYWGIEVFLVKLMVNESTIGVSIKIVIWELGIHSFVYTVILLQFINMDLVMIIFWDFCLSFFMHLGFQYTSGHEYVSVILVCFSICIQDLFMLPIKRLLDMHPSMSTLQWLYYSMH